MNNSSTAHPVESKQTLKLKVKVIKDEIKAADTIIKQYERNAQVQLTTDEQTLPDDLGCSRDSNDPDMQKLLWELEDSIALANTVKEELKEKAEEKRKEKETLEQELADLTNKLLRICPTSRFVDGAIQDFVGCVRKINRLPAYVFGTTLVWVAFTTIAVGLASLTGSMEVSLIMSLFLAFCILLTAMDIANKSTRPTCVRLTLIAAMFPLSFRVLPGAVAAFLISSTVVPQAAIHNTVSAYLKDSAAPVGKYWQNNFNLLDLNEDNVITTDELAALRTKLNLKVPGFIGNLESPEGKRIVEQLNVLDTSSPANMLEHLQLQFREIAHATVYKRNSHFGRFVPQEYAISSSDLFWHEMYRR